MSFQYTKICFPGLGLEFDPYRFIGYGDIKVYFYGIIIACGMALAMVYAWKHAKQFGIKEDDLTDGFIWVVPFAILCARLYYVAFKWEDYASNPISILHINKGGLAIYGGVIGAIIGVLIHCKVKKIKVTALLDLVALGFLIGQSIGRWGNFFNREAFGAETDVFWRMGLWDTSAGKYIYVHPTFFYESLWNAIGFVILHFASKHRKYDGQIALGYCAWYGLGRCIIEGLRADSLYWGPFRVSQVLAAVSCFAGVLILMIKSMKPHDPQNLFVNQLAAKAAAQTQADEGSESVEEPETIEESATVEETEE